MEAPETIRLLLDVGSRPCQISQKSPRDQHLSPQSSDIYVCARIISYIAPRDFGSWSNILEDLIAVGSTYYKRPSLPGRHLALEAFFAVTRDNHLTLKQLINNGASLFWEQFLYTPLTLAVQLDQVYIVRTLLDPGLPIDVQRGLDVSENCLRLDHPPKITFVISQSFDPLLKLRLMMDDLALRRMQEVYTPELQDLWSRCITTCFDGNPWLSLETDQEINKILLKHLNILESQHTVKSKHD